MLEFGAGLVRGLHSWGVALLEGWSLGRAWCGGTIHGVFYCIAGGLEFGVGWVRGYQHASGGRLITVPPIQACCQHDWCLASVGTLPPREGGLHNQWSDYTDLCRGKAAPLVIGSAVDTTIPYPLLHLSVRIAEPLVTGND